MSSKLKAIGLALIVVCAFGAVSAGAAQAAPNWTIEGVEFTGTETVSVTNTGALLLEVPATGLTISCTSVSAPGSEIFETKKDSAESLTFTGCTVVGFSGCEVFNFGGTGGTIKTPGVKSELQTIDGSVYDVFSPATGTEFVTIVVQKKTGLSCALSTGAAGSKVSGKVALKPAAEDAVSLTATTSEAIQKAATQSLTFGANPSYLVGDVDFALSGANKGKKWGVNP